LAFLFKKVSGFVKYIENKKIFHTIIKSYRYYNQEDVMPVTKKATAKKTTAKKPAAKKATTAKKKTAAKKKAK